jgi:uncharacterized protein DUF2852
MVQQRIPTHTSNREAVMPIVEKLDELGKPAWIALMILGFVTWWPLGFAMLAFIIGSGRMGCSHYYGTDRWQRKMERLQEKMERMRQRTSWGTPPWGSRSSGNRAFDEYRADTLRRLEEEQKEFHEFLDRLRQAKDKVEFDQFMADRRNRPPQPPQGPEGPSGSPYQGPQPQV